MDGNMTGITTPNPLPANQAVHVSQKPPKVVRVTKFLPRPVLLNATSPTALFGAQQHTQ